jgi:hypothetical protein
VPCMNLCLFDTVASKMLVLTLISQFITTKV